MSSFTDTQTRPIAQGDTPSIVNQKTRTIPMAAENILKGSPCVIDTGIVTLATNTNVAGNSKVVPVESLDNSTGSPGDFNIKIVDAGPETGPFVALTSTEALDIDEFVEINAANEVIAFTGGTRFARYLGKEAGVFSISGSTPFDQTLSPGQVPVQPLLVDEVGWFKILEVA